MDGYATLNMQQFETALVTAITNLSNKVRADETEKQLKVKEIWEKRTPWFGPWSLAGAESRYQDWIGCGIWAILQRVDLLREYRTQLERLNRFNAEPYMISLKDFNKLMSHQEP